MIPDDLRERAERYRQQWGGTLEEAVEELRAADAHTAATSAPPPPQPRPALRERVYEALRDDPAMFSDFGAIQRVDKVLAWAEQSEDSAEEVEAVLRAMTGNVQKPLRWFLSFFLLSGARNANKIKGGPRRMVRRVGGDARGRT